MLGTPIERRHSPDRRSSCGGGRRMTDLHSRQSDSPACPKCRERGVALQAGESDGGWWFVCLACDHLWDERHANEESAAACHDDAGRASLWRRLAFRRSA